MPQLSEQQATSQLATVGRDIVSKYDVSNQNPDKLIRSKGLRYIEEIERDTHYSSVLRTRRQKLVKKDWVIRPAERNGKITARSREIADFVDWNLRAMVGSFEKDIEAALDCISKGYSLSEIIYRKITAGRYAGKLGLKAVRFKPARYFDFRFDIHGNYSLVQIDPNPAGVALPIEKFIHMVSGNNDENPYGEGSGSKVAFWVWLKKNQAKFWAIFSERFGMPLSDVEIPKNATEADKAKAEEIIEEMQTRAGIIRPEGFNVAFLEAARRGDVTYDNFIERCNKEISKEVLGATLISEEGKRGQGSYALGSNHATVLEDYVVFDAAMTATAINEQLIRPLVDFNFVTDDYPTFRWEGVDVSALISMAQSLDLLGKMGMRIPAAWAHDKAGIPQAREGEPTLSAGPEAPGTPANVTPLKVDNRSAAAFLDSMGVRFAELPPEIQTQIEEVDSLTERYLSLAGERFDAIAAEIRRRDKKKSSA